MATTAKWETIQIELPSTITDIATVLDDLVGALLAILDVVRAVLDVIKAFLISFTDPITAIIEAIISAIESLLNDIAQIGVYVAGDLDIAYPFDDLLGGYAAFERRMIGLLTNRADPTRPAFSSDTEVVAIFLYSSSDLSLLQDGLAFIDGVRRFFGVPGKTQSFPMATGLTVTYGAETTGIGAFEQAVSILEGGSVPSRANVRWKMASPLSGGQVPFPLPTPPGFLIEVSTVPDGLFLAYQTPVSNAEKDKDGKQHQIRGLVSNPDGSPFKLYGGLGILVLKDLDWDSLYPVYYPPTGDGSSQLSLYASSTDNVAIPPNALVTFDGKSVLQRTFFIDQSFLGLSISPGQPLSVTLKAEDMPYGATFEDRGAGDGSVRMTVSDTPAQEVYVRVSPVSKDVKGTGVATGPVSTFAWTLNEGRLKTGESGIVTILPASQQGPSDSAKGPPSSPLKVTFLDSSSVVYVDTVTTALLVMVLSRSDLLAMGTDDVAFNSDVGGQATGMEDVARYLIPKILNTNPSTYFTKNSSDPTSFRSNLLRRCRTFAEGLLLQVGVPPTAVRDLVTGFTVTTTNGGDKSLPDVLWQDLDSTIELAVTIRDSLDRSTTSGSSAQFGVAPQPLSIGMNIAFVNDSVGDTTLLPRQPGFLVPTLGYDTTGAYSPLGSGSADGSPVLYSRSTTDNTDIVMVFCRNVFLANPSILTVSAQVLSIAAAPLMHKHTPGVGHWHAYRLFPQGLPNIEGFFAEITKFLDSITAGIKGVTDTIIAYINFIESRILELEALLQRIEALLDITLSFTVPTSSGLVVTAAGTDGILQALVTAENKPSDSSAITTRIDARGNTVLGGTYGFGVVLLTGGLPTVVAELVKALFVGS